jgi:hypothetical protein
METPDGVDRCMAFPDGIPPAYLSGAELHLEVDEDQQSDTVFEKRDDVDQETVDVVIDNWDLMRAQSMYDALPEGDGLGENR